MLKMTNSECSTGRFVEASIGVLWLARTAQWPTDSNHSVHVYTAALPYSQDTVREHAYDAVVDWSKSKRPAGQQLQPHTMLGGTSLILLLLPLRC
jgi:hypothetical protein